MKWMMSSVAMLIAVVLSVTAIAQSGGTMARGDKMDRMDKMEMKDMTHTGCVEAGSAPGTFMLTDLAADDHMGKDTVVPTTFSLSSASIDLSKHVGHKVSVTGSSAHGKMDAMEKDTMAKGTPAFTVKSLKMVAASCS
jgi:hypothetical protein